MRMTALPSDSVLVRTWFGDDNAWESLVSEVQTPSEEGFLAQVTLVNDPTFEGLSAEALKAAQADGNAAIVSFLADETTLTSAEHPILAVWVLPLDDDDPDHRPFRVAPSHLWSVENNINVATMGWEDFTRSVGADGVFRGFKARSRHPSEGHELPGNAPDTVNTMPSVYVYSRELTGVIVLCDSSILDAMTTIKGWRQSGDLISFTGRIPDNDQPAAMLVDFSQLPAVSLMVDNPMPSPKVPVWEPDVSAYRSQGPGFGHGG